MSCYVLQVGSYTIPNLPLLWFEPVTFVSEAQPDQAQYQMVDEDTFIWN